MEEEKKKKEFLEKQAKIFIEELEKKPLRKAEKYYYGVVGKSVLFISDGKGKVLFSKKGQVKTAFQCSKMLQSFVTRCAIADFIQKYPNLYQEGTADFFHTDEYWQVRNEIKELVNKTNPLDLQVLEFEQESLTGEGNQSSCLES